MTITKFKPPPRFTPPHRLSALRCQPAKRTRMDEIQDYIQASEAKLDKDYPTPQSKGQAIYNHAQILTSVGRYSESLEYLEQSYHVLKKSISDPSYKRLFCLVGLHYATTLDYLGKYDKAGDVFSLTMEVDPSGVHIGDYALFLHRRKRDFDKAQVLYLRALELYPQHSSINLKYAGFLRHTRRDIPGAEKFYLKAVEASPNNADALGSYASFLHGVHNNIKEAEKYYQKAVDADDTHTNNLCNYGLFLSEEKKKYDLAEKMYIRALEVHAKHANTLYNYAVMLDTHLKRKEEAEGLYRRALEVEPRHAFALYNLAVLLEERYSVDLIAQAAASAEIASTMGPNIAAAMEDPDFKEKDLKKREEILGLYQRAVEADPRDTTTLADYGRYILVRMENAPKAESILEAALRMNADCEIAIYNLAVISHRHKMDFVAAEAYLRKLLKLSPVHNAGTLQLARLLSEVHFSRANVTVTPELEATMDEICTLFEKSIAATKDPTYVLAEYLKLVERSATNKRKLKTIASMAGAVDTQVQAVKAAAGTPGATPAAAVNEVKSVLESLKSSTTK